MIEVIMKFKTIEEALATLTAVAGVNPNAQVGSVIPVPVNNVKDADTIVAGMKVAAPVTPAPVTPAPVTPAPVTPAPVTPAPVTPAPVTAEALQAAMQTKAAEMGDDGAACFGVLGEFGVKGIAELTDEQRILTFDKVNKL